MKGKFYDVDPMPSRLELANRDQLPTHYGYNYLGLTPLEPNSIFVYWEVTTNWKKMIGGLLEQTETEMNFILKLYYEKKQEQLEEECYEWKIPNSATSCIITNVVQKQGYIAKIGFLHHEHFLPILRSRSICRQSEDGSNEFRFDAISQVLKSGPDIPFDLQEDERWILRHLHVVELQLRQMLAKVSTQHIYFNRAVKQMIMELIGIHLSEKKEIDQKYTRLVRAQEIFINSRFNQLTEDEFIQLEEKNKTYMNAYPVQLEPATEVSIDKQRPPALRVLVLSWEYPPYQVGGVSTAVRRLSEHLVAYNIEIHLLTYGPEGAKSYEVIDGVHVYRVNTCDERREEDFLTWIFQLNLAMIAEFQCQTAFGLKVDLVHAHEWLTSYAAQELKRSYDLPIVYTMHGIEKYKCESINVKHNEYVHLAESQLTKWAHQIIVCSKCMVDGVRTTFEHAEEKIKLIHNGVLILERLNHTKIEQLRELRSRIALPEERILFFAGRMIIEKGIALLVEAIPYIIHCHPNTKFVLSGEGYLKEALQQRIEEQGFGSQVLFTGFVDEETLHFLYRLAYLYCLPSLHEPFGITVLEAMSHQTPVLVSDACGPDETVEDHVTGIKVSTGSVESLIVQINWALDHPQEMNRLARNAYLQLPMKYNWKRIAAQTLDVYQSALYMDNPVTK
ncbi:glycosyltransferase [Hazenella sp. IB182357]|uniref:Glycosyltransferase n=1 Tax=Polycladospora coralii TaxID=2771432 RepID=A0A926NBQ6_9BACL|nr:glycosyltransferase [Polycladospora coralii]MBD1373642.1 glycosyltransferase [Polycladospora coralii]